MFQSLDIRSLLLLGALLSLTLAGVMIYFSLARKTYPGFHHWTGGYVSIGIGTVLVTLRGMLPDFVSIIVGNALIAVMPVMLARGLETFAGLHRKRGAVDAALFAAFLAVFVWGTYVQPSLQLRIVCLSAMMLLYFAYSLHLAVRHLPAVLGERNQLLILMASFTVVSLLFRIVITLPSGGELFFMARSDANQAAAIILTILSVCGISCSLVILNSHRIERELREANRKIVDIARRDALTGLFNRGHFDLSLDREFKRLQRSGLPLSLIMADIDYFKDYNDTYGHQAGDDCLRAVAEVIRRAGGRIADLAARYGGEEFVLILPDTDARGARVIADQVQRYMRGMAIRHDSSRVSEIVTLSLGVATVAPNRAMRPGDLVRMADEALYRSKAAGRNRVEVHARCGSDLSADG